MSLGFLPVFKPALGSACYEPDGCGMLSFADALDDLADHLGIPHLTSFADNRDVPDDFEGDPWELDEVSGPWEEWFSPTDGLIVVAGLRSALQQNTTFINDPEDREWVLSELDPLYDILQTAASEGSQFRLEIES